MGRLDEAFAALEIPEIVVCENKVLIEGGFQDGWHFHWLDVIDDNVPEDVGWLRAGVYGLPLIGKVTNRGYVPEEGTLRVHDIHYGPFSRIQRPRGAITSDGRVFYDTSMGPENQRKLPSFLRQMIAHHGPEYWRRLDTIPMRLDGYPILE